MAGDVLRRAWRPIYGQWLALKGRRARSQRLRFYRSLIAPGDLVFDVGANVGERSEVFLALGARVVAVEPQRECTARLRERWRAESRFQLFEGACAEAPGERELFVASASTLSSMSRDWIDAVSEAEVFAERWEEKRLVPTTTLDELIAEHGEPQFVKVDVEGFEQQVLAGLSGPVGCLSIEWHPLSPGTRSCVEHLDALGMTEFNASLGEQMTWALPDWVSAADVLAFVESAGGWGDLYARNPRGA